MSVSGPAERLLGSTAGSRGEILTVVIPGEESRSAPPVAQSADSWPERKIRCCRHPGLDAVFRWLHQHPGRLTLRYFKVAFDEVSGREARINR